MIDLVEKINKEFKNKYDYLKFLDVIYERDNSLCTITFLYPYDKDNLKDEEQKEIEEYVQKLFFNQWENQTEI